MTRFRYLLVTITVLSCAAALLWKHVPPLYEGSLSVDLVGVIVILAVLCVGSWNILGALSLLLAALLASRLDRWRYLLVVMTLASWLAMHLLNYVSGIADRLVDPFKVCWLALFFLALVAPFRRRWREFAISGLTLFVTFGAFLLTLAAPEKGGVLPNRWLQETGFQIYASHLVRSTPQEELLSRCKLVDYVEEDGTRQQVGECNKGFRSTLWFEITLIYDPAGQLVWPAIKRTLAWRLAVLHLPEGRSFVHDDDAAHLVGDFYWILAPPDLSGDDGRVRPD